MRVDAVVISTQHDPDVPLDVIRHEVTEKHHRSSDPEGRCATRTLRIFVNPTGRFVIGGPKGDAGLTGRKIIADTYGGMARHGGGAFSGKDPTKVDRSAAYAARYVAKNVVAAGLADRCEVQVAYAIGVAHPVSVLVETFGTDKIDEEQIAEAGDATPSICVRRRSSTTSICAVRSTSRPRRTATSAVRISICRGSVWIKSTLCGRPLRSPVKLFAFRTSQSKEST